MVSRGLGDVYKRQHGSIEQVGTPEEIYSTPASPFVADFIGVMNCLLYTSDAADEV